MVKLAVVLAVISTSISLTKARSSQQINIQNFLQDLQQQLTEEQRQEEQRKNELQNIYYPNSGYYDTLNNEVKRLFSRPSNKRKKERSSNKLHRKQRRRQEYYVLRDPFSQNIKLAPNTLMGDDLEDDPSYVDDNREDKQKKYSKVYVVLNSEAIKKSKNKDKLNAFLSSLLESSQDQDRSQHQQGQIEQYIEDRSKVNDNRHENHLGRYSVVNGHNRYQNKRYRLLNSNQYSSQDDRVLDSNRYSERDDDRLLDDNRYRERDDDSLLGSNRYRERDDDRLLNSNRYRGRDDDRLFDSNRYRERDDDRLFDSNRYRERDDDRLLNSNRYRERDDNDEQGRDGRKDRKSKGIFFLLGHDRKNNGMRKNNLQI